MWGAAFGGVGSRRPRIFAKSMCPKALPPVHPAGCCQHGLPSVHAVCSSPHPRPPPPIQPRACTLVGSLRKLEGSGFTPWGLSPQPTEMWDLRFSQTRGPRPDTRWLDRQVTSQREAGGCPVSPRGTWLCLTLVRPMARLTPGVILPVRPGPPFPSPGTAGLLDWEEGGSRRAADAGSLSDRSLGPTSWRADQPPSLQS